MPKRRRLLNTLSSAEKQKVKQEPKGEVLSARGRLQGALLDVLEPPDSDSSDTGESAERRRSGRESGDAGDTSDGGRSRSASPARGAYVLKLFDRSVDLSQFHEDSPLYPVCRAWIINQPRAVYKRLRAEPEREPRGETLPGPDGEAGRWPPAPPLLPEQRAASKDNINLNYRECAPISRDRLLHAHLQRWSRVREAWLEHGRGSEARHAAAQRALDRLHVSM